MKHEKLIKGALIVFCIIGVLIGFAQITVGIMMLNAG